MDQNYLEREENERVSASGCECLWKFKNLFLSHSVFQVYENEFNTVDAFA